MKPTPAENRQVDGAAFVPSSDAELQAMAQEIGLASPEDVFSEIPENLRVSRPLLSRAGISQDRLAAMASAIAAQTRLDRPCFLGGGFYDRFVPPALVETILRRTDYYSAYTPYQAEASQGILQAIFEYQQGICALTGLDVANASLYDGATALAEAVMCLVAATGMSAVPDTECQGCHSLKEGAASEKPRAAVAVSTAVHPHYRAVLRTYLSDLPVRMIEVPHDPAGGVTPAERFAAAGADVPVVAFVAQNPNFFGVIEDMKSIGEAARTKNAGFVHVFEPVSLSVLATPGETGADVAVGEGQSLGLPLLYGGLPLGIFAAREKFLRRVPGRIVGRTLDAAGNDAFCLTLQTREQHIRREKATSNICTNNTLCAIYAGAYLRLMGDDGLRRIVETSAARMDRFADGLKRRAPGVTPVFSEPSLSEIVVKSEKKLEHLPVLNLGAFYPEMKNSYLVSFTERRTDADVDWLLTEMSR